MPIRLQPSDFAVHRTELLTRTSTVLLVDMSRSMLLRGCFLAAKKVAVALDTLIRTQYPRDDLSVIGFAYYAREIPPGALAELTWHGYEYGTNLQHGLLLARRTLERQAASNKEIVVITDGEPTAHFEDGQVEFNYPPTRRTITETLREVQRCTKDGITINTFMLERSRALAEFVAHMTRLNRGRAFYASPERLGEYVLVDFVNRRTKRVMSAARSVLDHRPWAMRSPKGNRSEGLANDRARLGGRRPADTCRGLSSRGPRPTAAIEEGSMDLGWLFPYLLFLHVLGAIVAFGPTFAFPFIGAMGGDEPQHANFAIRVSRHAVASLGLPDRDHAADHRRGHDPGPRDQPARPRRSGGWQSRSSSTSSPTAIPISSRASSSRRVIEITSTPPPPGASGPPPELPPIVARIQRGGMVMTVLLLTIIFLMVVKPTI